MSGEDGGSGDPDDGEGDDDVWESLEEVSGGPDEADGTGDGPWAGTDDRGSAGEDAGVGPGAGDRWVEDARGVDLDGVGEDEGERDGGVRDVSLDGQDADDDEAFWAAYGRTRRSEPTPEAVLTDAQGGRTGLRDIGRADLREHYGPIRTLFKRREAAYRSFQRQLTQARIPRTYDQYLARVVGRMLGVLVAGVALGGIAGLALVAGARYGYVSGLLPVVVLRPGAAARLALGLGTGAGVLGAAAYWIWWRIVRIRSRIARRRREINYNLPYAITFMYALARADVGFDRIVARLADSTATYGAAAEEFDRVVRDVEMFGNNVYGGLENLRVVTPSEELGRFVADLTTVLETGGDLAGFLRDEVDTQLETATAEQEAFLERLELLSEVFVVGFVAAPLFVLVVLFVVSFLGAGTLDAMAALVYVVLPLALVGFVVLVDSISQSFVTRPVSFSSSREEVTPPPESPADPDWRAAYERDRRIRGLRARLTDQLARTRDDPWRAFLFSVPIGLAVPVAGVVTGAVPLEFSALLARPVEVTTELAVVPLVIATTPVAIAYEYRRREELALQRRFPDLLELLATSNRRGLSLTRGLDIVANSTSGRLGDEVQQLRNDVRWNADLPAAFEAFGDRLSAPELTRTVNLVAEGSRATSDLHVVLEVAATDLSERVRLERERRETLQTYLAIVVIGFLVYLLVVILLSSNFLDPIEALGSETADDGAPISLGAVPVDQLRLVLFHSALIQGFGSGLLAGKLAENSLYSGLKYGIALVVVAVLAFTVV